MKAGIDAIAFDTAPLHLTIRSLATVRGIDPDKLEKGLGLIHMTIPDVYQDTVVFGANALTRLILQNNLDPATISRIYVGTESSIDSSKPIASFLISLMEQKFGAGKLGHCDAVDFTFACIGAVDALQNCLDFVRLNPEKKAVVVATDIAKYDLGSTGEYTQGAGAIALLVTSDPSIMAFEQEWAISTKGVFDFFKPYHIIPKTHITGNDENVPWLGHLEKEIEIHKDQPVFDGQYSNQCYMERTRDAYFSFRKEKGGSGSLYDTWEQIIMHLPYSFHGRRMLTEIFMLDAPEKILCGKENPAEYQNILKEMAKSADYRAFVAQKLAAAERASSLTGNLYTGSIFMALLSALSQALETGAALSGEKFGFLAYGSGSKSKVFEGTVRPGWKAALSGIGLFDALSKSTGISFETYEQLHKKELKQPVRTPKNEWVLDRIEKEIPNLTGARYYRWTD